MFFGEYYIFLIAILACFVISAVASSRVRTTFAKYDSIGCRSGLSGKDTVARLFRINGINDIAIGRVGGVLSDHYHPAKHIINLSESTYSSNSVAAVAVAAHEVGHVMQNKDGYFFYRIRTALVPVVNFGSRLAMPLVLVGLIVDITASSVNPNVGFYIAMGGVVLYFGTLLFALITLPVELDASKRAKRMLKEAGIISDSELPYAKNVLSAAAMTYLASLLTSLVYFLRFLYTVLVIFGGRNNRR